MKLYALMVNTGEWGGATTDYVLAENKEEAATKNGYFQRAKENGVECHIFEMTGDSILRKFLGFDCAKKYTMTFEIKEKE